MDDHSCHPSYSITHTAPIVGGLAWGAAFVALAVSVDFYYQRRMQRFVISGESPFVEMDGQRAANGIMDRDVCWESTADM